MQNLKKLIIISVFLIIGTTTAQAQANSITPPETTTAVDCPTGRVCILQETADKCRSAFERVPALEDKISALEDARKADAAVIGTLREIVDLNRAENKELRAAVMELIKSAKPKKSKFCLALCF